MAPPTKQTARKSTGCAHPGWLAEKKKREECNLKREEKAKREAEKRLRAECKKQEIELSPEEKKK